VLVNRIESPTIGSTCPTGNSVSSCQTSTPVAPRTISLTGLTEDFILTGLPNTTVSSNGIVRMTVTTNSTTGYTVSVRSTVDRLSSSTPGNSETIPIDRLSVRESDGSPTWLPLSLTGQTVHEQQQPSSPGGDAVSNDYQIEIPFVPSDSYQATLEYVVTAQ